MKFVTAVCVLAAINVFATIHASRPTQQTRLSVHQTPATAGAQSVSQPRERFDHTVRADFFAGMRGDKKRFARAMEACEKMLAVDPNHVAAMVWHGSGLMFSAGDLFRQGDTAKALDLWERGKREMDAAVALAPDSVDVLVPRGATLLESSRYVPGEERAAMLAKGVADYEKVLAIQQPYFQRLSAHARGELLFGLAEGWARAGDAAEARRYFEQILTDAQGSGQEARAKTWLETGQLSSTRCIGCH